MELTLLAVLAIIGYFGLRLIIKDLGKSEALSTIAEATAENIAARAKASSVLLAIEANTEAKDSGLNDLGEAQALLKDLIGGVK